MPLFLRKDIKTNCKMAVWNITEREAELSEMISFSEQDRGVLKEVKHELRRLQWMATRELLKQLTGENDLRISYDVFGKPFLADSEIKISISHSHNKAALIINKEETGIDIELIKEKIVRIENKFMSQTEMKNVKAENKKEMLSIYWCAKESLYKLYGKKELHFKENIRIADFSYNKEGIISGKIVTKTLNESYRLHYLKLDDFMLTYVLP